jgi:hypothetical protein
MRKGKIIQCDNCGKDKFKTLFKLKRDKNHFCSSACYSEYKSKTQTSIVSCSACGKPLKRPLSRIKNNPHFAFCDTKCRSIGLIGVNLSGFFKKGNKKEKCINYKDGTQIINGYISVTIPEHPHADKKGRVYQHRLVMEEKIGRYLLPEEVVHHIDEDKQNNHPDNLMLFDNDAEHHRHHGMIRRSKITA